MIKKLFNLISSDNRLKKKIFYELNILANNKKEVKVLNIGSSDYSRIQDFKIPNLKLTLFDIKFFDDTEYKNVDKVTGDVTNIEKHFKEKEFDAIFALDLIEHLEKEKGEELIKKLIKISGRLIVIYTPNGFLYQKGTENNPYQEHRSGWHVSDFKKYDFEVLGMLGHKFFRGEYHKLRSPIILSYIISFLTFYFTNKAYPELDSALLAIKKI